MGGIEHIESPHKYGGYQILQILPIPLGALRFQQSLDFAEEYKKASISKAIFSEWSITKHKPLIYYPN